MNEAGKGDKRRNESTDLVRSNWDSISWTKPLNCKTTQDCEWPLCKCETLCLKTVIARGVFNKPITKIPQTCERANFNDWKNV